jgi:hypothetical protein
VVGFRGVYHTILGRPFYDKFMAIPNYVYFKLKMSGPKGIIMLGPSFACSNVTSNVLSTLRCSRSTRP